MARSQTRGVSLAFVVSGHTALGKPRKLAAAVGGPAQRLDAGFFVEP
jgi:hypothetical protein